jgi:hypothetical protein
MIKKHAFVYLAAAVWLTSGAPMAFGADKKIVGKKVMLRTPVLSADQNRFLYISNDPSIIFGGTADSDTPSLHGASLVVFNPTSGECQCIQMPASNWEVGEDGRRYAYHDPGTVDGPIKLVQIRDGKLKVTGKGNKLTGITLDETTQGTIAMNFRSGNSATKLCSTFSGLSVRVDRVTAFIGTDSPPGGACDVEPAGCLPCDPIP